MNPRLVGIDLGTSHTVVAWAECARGAEPHIFLIPQRVAATEEEARPLLPSCLYALLPDEGGSPEHPWLVGEHARNRGREVPGRLVASSKSWLAYGAVDRLAPILPWARSSGSAKEGEAGDDVPRISPVDAARLVLEHVKGAWNQDHPEHPLERQEVVLTVPASFDEVARELTVEAARRAGLTVRLLEEPQAAFYDYMHHADIDGLAGLAAKAGGDARVLVCDVGGGTTDLSLLRVRSPKNEKKPPLVERVAVGDHLLLGGDNMDLALAHLCEGRMVKSPDRLPPAQFQQLVAACRAAKERLLTPPRRRRSKGAPKEEASEGETVTVLGQGSRLLGGARSTRLLRHEVEALVLDGFFPKVSKDEQAPRARGGLVAFGLPYEREVAITRHVAAFLARHGEGDLHAVLLNGGVFLGASVAKRLLDVVGSWGEARPVVLPHGDPDLAVARGAVAYALARRGFGPAIEGGAARAYYMGLAGEGRQAVCVVPQGAKEGVAQRVTSQNLALTVGRPVRFDLFVATGRERHKAGDVVTLDDEHQRPLPPVAVRFDRGSAAKGAASLRVALEGELTPVGTLDLACVEAQPSPGVSPRRFRLVFQLRGESAESEGRISTTPQVSAPAPVSGALAAATERLQAAFKTGADGSTRSVKDLVRDLEKLLGERPTWTTEENRALVDALLPLRAGRRRTADHERVFWLLAGYCVRPGFGAPGDDGRAAVLAGIFPERLTFPDQARGWQQFWIAFRRVAGGLLEGTQTSMRDTVDPFVAPADAGLKRPKKWKPEAESDLVDMVASLERVDARRRAALGGWILERTWTDRDPRLWAALGRVGARVPSYGSIHQVVEPTVVERWLEQLLREKWETVPTAAPAAVAMARQTGDRARDVSPRLRTEVERRLVAASAREEWLRAVREIVPVEEGERAAFFGEGLPVGLRLLP